METVANLIKAIAALLWPILGFTALFLFKIQLRELLHRLRRGKLFGQELELDASLRELNTAAVAVADEVSKIPPPLADAPIKDATADTAQQMLKLMESSPTAALVTLSASIEREARDLVAVTGHLNGRTHIGLREAIAEITDTSGLPPHVGESLKQFNDVRNRIVHGAESTNGDIVRAIDSGITILRALQAIPRETNIVWHPGVTVYSDPHLQSPIPGVKGVILEATSPGGAEKTKRVFPSTKDWFRKGQRVSWEWSLVQKWGKAWYRDPETSEIKTAWGAAAEFVGRPLDRI
jgi:hypothetical protein